VGAIFAGGPRRLDAARARTVLEAARTATPGLPPQAVGVMGRQSPAEMLAIADEAGLDVLQLHADPDASTVDAVRRAAGRPVWGVLRIAGTQVPAHAAALFAAADAVVLDAKVDGQLGGTGVALPWAALAAALAPLRGATPLVLAGGLHPGNVADAVAALAPDVVDVSSGVEQAPGVKDPARMAAFAAAVAATGLRPDARLAASPT
jgi:phosphoribosylanthranilate isomerase